MLALTVSSYSPEKSAKSKEKETLSGVTQQIKWFFYLIIKRNNMMTFDGVLTLQLHYETNLLRFRATCYIGKCKIYRRCLVSHSRFHVSRHDSASLHPWKTPAASQSSTLAMAIKNLWLTFYVFFTAYFSKCMLNKPRKSDSVVSVLLVHIMFILMGDGVIQVLNSLDFMTCNQKLLRTILISHRKPLRKSSSLNEIPRFVYPRRQNSIFFLCLTNRFSYDKFFEYLMNF